jgi:hypothetical protein
MLAKRTQRDSKHVCHHIMPTASVGMASIKPRLTKHYRTVALIQRCWLYRDGSIIITFHETRIIPVIGNWHNTETVELYHNAKYYVHSLSSAVRQPYMVVDADFVRCYLQ